MTASLAARRAIEAFAAAWPCNHASRRVEVYLEAVDGCHPKDVEEVCRDLVAVMRSVGAAESVGAVTAAWPAPAIIVRACREREDARTRERERKTSAQKPRARPSYPPTEVVSNERRCRGCSGPAEILVEQRMVWCPRCQRVLMHDAGNGRRIVVLPAAEIQELVRAATRTTTTRRTHDGTTPPAGAVDA